MSHTTPRFSAPRSSSSRHVCAMRSSFHSATTTRAPPLPRCTAIPLPTPLPEPVTMITLPATVCMSIALAAVMTRNLRSDDMGTLEGGVVVVSGGGSGIGRATAARAAREGAAVAVVDLHAGNAEETVAMIEGAGGRARAYPCDVGDDAAVSAAI